MDLRGFGQRGSKFGFTEKEMRRCGGTGAAMALVDLRGMREMLVGRVAQVLRLVQKDYRFEGAFRQFEKRALAARLGRVEEGRCFPGGRGLRSGMRCANECGDIPFRKRQETSSLDGRDGALRARIKFAH